MNLTKNMNINLLQCSFGDQTRKITANSVHVDMVIWAMVTLLASRVAAQHRLRIVTSKIHFNMFFDRGNGDIRLNGVTPVVPHCGE